MAGEPAARLKPAAGTGDFGTFGKESRYYAGKARFLKAVFEDGGNTYLILRPGRFGKMNTLCRKFRRMQESPVIADANKQEFCDTASRSMTGNAR